jgi:hypothetical protein
VCVYVCEVQRVTSHCLVVYQQSSKRIKSSKRATRKVQWSNNKEQKGLAPMVQSDSSRRISYLEGLLLYKKVQQRSNT